MLGPPKDKLVLEGIRYGLIEQLCAQTPASRSSCAASRATRCSAPTSCCCPRPARKSCRSRRSTASRLANGRPGPIYQALYAAYQRAKARSMQDNESQHEHHPRPRPSDAPDDARKESLIDYPSHSPIKVMGAKVDGFVHAVMLIARQFDPPFDADDLSSCATARPATTSASRSP